MPSNKDKAATGTARRKQETQLNRQAQARKVMESDRHKVRVALRVLTSQIGYQYLKDVGYQMADIQLGQPMTTLGGITGFVEGAILRRALQKMFHHVENEAVKVPRMMVPEKMTE